MHDARLLEAARAEVEQIHSSVSAEYRDGGRGEESGCTGFECAQSAFPRLLQKMAIKMWMCMSSTYSCSARKYLAYSYLLYYANTHKHTRVDTTQLR